MATLSRANEAVLDELLLGLSDGVALRDLPAGELLSVRKELRELNAEALAEKHANPGYGEWHDITSTALRLVNAELARDRALQRRQLNFLSELSAHA
jgi:hypothetical protein